MSVTAGWTNYGPITSIFTPPSNCNYLTISYATPTTALPNPSSTTAPNTHYGTPLSVYMDEPSLRMFNPSVAPTCFPSQYPTTQGPLVTQTIATFGASITSISHQPTRGYFSPGHCPEGWKTQTLDYSFFPTGNTLALCCPTSFNGMPLPTTTNTLEKRRGTRPQKFLDTTCEFKFPPLAVVRTAVDSYPSVTAVANGSLATLAPQDWFGTNPRVDDAAQKIIATGIVVMWKQGDFADIDAAVASASASAAAEAKKNDSAGQAMSRERKIGLWVGILLGLSFHLLCV